MREEDRMMWIMAMMATLMAGKSVQEATKNADQAKAAFNSRFNEEVVED